jgi:Regulator of Chromosome Condensation (RCC1) repeat protein
MKAGPSFLPRPGFGIADLERLGVFSHVHFTNPAATVWINECRICFVLILCIFALLLNPPTAWALQAQEQDENIHWHGTIGNTLEVEFTVHLRGMQLAGYYQYASQRKRIPVKGKMPKAYEYELDEMGADGAVAAHLKLSELAGPEHPSGTWASADGKRKLPVTLGRITTERHELLQRIWNASPQIKSIVTGFDFACAVRDLGTLCWGDVPGMPSLALAGPGMVAHRALPNLLLDESVTAFTNGFHRPCFLKSGGLWCMQPYDPKLPLRKPTRIPGFEQNVTMIGSGERYTCAIVQSALKCWDGASLSGDSVLEVIPAGVTRLSSGEPQCAVVDGKVKCWFMEFQPRENNYKLVVEEVSDLKGDLTDLSAHGADNQHYACAIDSEGLKCWAGRYNSLILGRKGAGGKPDLGPALVPGFEKGVTAVYAGPLHACAVKNAKVYCWGGFNFFGELGDGTTHRSETPVEVKNLDNVIQVAVGTFYTCALRADNRVFCWGRNDAGQTGNVSHHVCKEPNGKVGTIDWPCSVLPVEVRGLQYSAFAQQEAHKGCGTVSTSFEANACMQISFEGEVSAGHLFEKSFGGGLVFRLNPEGALSGWIMQAVPEARPGTSGTDPHAEYIWVVNPPYRGRNARYLDTSYGVTAKEAVQSSPYDFNFVLSQQQFEEASDLVDKAIMSTSASDRRSREEIVEEGSKAADRLLTGLPVSKGRLVILDSRIGNSDKAVREEAIEWLKFRVDLRVPCSFNPDSKAAGITVDRSRCPIASRSAKPH